jgi:type I restriction enzyme S subunit
MGNENSLGQHIEIKHGFAFKGEYFSEQSADEVLVTPGNFAIGGGFKDEKPKFYHGPVPEDYVLSNDDLVVTMTDLSKAGDTLGLPALIPATLGRRYLHNQRVGLISVKDDSLLDRRFLYYRLRSSDYRNHILATASGSTVRHTSPGRIMQFETVLPPIETQRSIAALLGSLDDKIKQNRCTVEKLGRLAATIFQAWFVDFEPVKAKAAGSTSLCSMSPELFRSLPTTFTTSKRGLLPTGWETKPIASIATFLNGLALQKYPAKGDSTDLPVIKISQLRQGTTFGADLANSDIPTEYKIQDRDLLFSWSGTLEVEFWFGGQGALNQHLFKVSSQHYPDWFILHSLQEHLPWFRMIAASKATTMGHIKREHLLRVHAVIASPEVMREADALIGPLHDLRARLLLESQSLATLRDLLLPKLLSGQVQVRVDGSVHG